VLFSIVQQVKGDPKLVYYALAMINGIIEDRRTRIKYFSAIQTSKNAEKQMDLLGILNSFLIQSHESDQKNHRDLAAHTQAMLIEAVTYEKCVEQARNFLNYLFEQKDHFLNQTGDAKLSKQAFTHSIMYLLKTNELAQDFVDRQGFKLMKMFLQDDCLRDGQVAYNICCTLWILTYHPFALKGFTDFQLNIIEDVSKILDYFNKEKIVRIVLMVFDNLKHDQECLEHLSMINALNLVIKLQNRPWVDSEIDELLERLYKYFDQNYHEFSSFEKWKKQIQRKQLAWSPVHTEKFWQAAFIFFNEADNLECINILIDILQIPNDSKDYQNVETMKAVACYDLGEFARFFPLGQQYLEQKGAKTHIARIMSSPSTNPELKKEAITSYQKLLMNSWGQGAN
jgi:V-type H+-transporting ATPase subunit H